MRVAVNFFRRKVGIPIDIATSNRLLWAGFLESSARFPNRGAIEIAGHEISYQQMRNELNVSPLQFGKAQAKAQLHSPEYLAIARRRPTPVYSVRLWQVMVMCR